MKQLHHPFLQPLTLGERGWEKGKFYFLLILAAGSLYGNFLGNPLVFDDGSLLANIADSHAGLLSYFSLRWLSLISIEWTWSMVGLDLLWLRLGNLLLHATNAIVLFAFLHKLFNCVLDQHAHEQTLPPVWLAFFGALLFTLHPVAVYGVAYLIQRSILMATLFSLLTWLAYLQGLIRGKLIWFITAAVCYFFAVFSKEHSVMVPAVALALTFLLRPPSVALFKQIAPAFILFALIGGFVILKSKGVLGSPYEPGAGEIFAQLSESRGVSHIHNAYPLSVLTQSFLFFKYLLLWIIPYPGWMSIDLREPFAIRFMSWPYLPGLLAFILYGAIAIKLLLARGKKGLAGFALLCPWLLFATELASVRVQESFVLYRSYLWMAGLFAALPLLCGGLKAKRAFALLLSISIVLFPLSWNRLNTFSSPVLLWDDAEKLVRNTAKQPWSDRIYYNRGNAYSKIGLRQQAIEDYNKAIAIHPGVSQMYNNRGFVYFEQGRVAEAMRDFDQAIEINPEHAKAHVGRALIYEMANNYPAAMENFKRSCELGLPLTCPKWRELYKNLHGNNP